METGPRANPGTPGLDPFESASAVFSRLHAATVVKLLFGHTLLRLGLIQIAHCVLVLTQGSSSLAPLDGFVGDHTLVSHNRSHSDSFRVWWYLRCIAGRVFPALGWLCTHKLDRLYPRNIATSLLNALFRTYVQLCLSSFDRLAFKQGHLMLPPPRSRVKILGCVSRHTAQSPQTSADVTTQCGAESQSVPRFHASRNVR